MTVSFVFTISPPNGRCLANGPAISGADIEKYDASFGSDDRLAAPVVFGAAAHLVAGNNGGAQALATLLRDYPALVDAGFTPSDIVKVAGNIGGAQALAALLPDYPALVDAGFTASDVVKVAGNIGGA